MLVKCNQSVTSYPGSTFYCEIKDASVFCIIQFACGNRKSMDLCFFFYGLQTLAVVRAAV